MNESGHTCIQFPADVAIQPSMHCEPFVLAATRDGFTPQERVFSTSLTNSYCTMGPTFIPQTSVHHLIQNRTDELTGKQSKTP